MYFLPRHNYPNFIPSAGKRWDYLWLWMIIWTWVVLNNNDNINKRFYPKLNCKVLFIHCKVQQLYNLCLISNLVYCTKRRGTLYMFRCTIQKILSLSLHCTLYMFRCTTRRFYLQVYTVNCTCLGVKSRRFYLQVYYTVYMFRCTI